MTSDELEILKQIRQHAVPARIGGDSKAVIDGWRNAAAHTEEVRVFIPQAEVTGESDRQPAAGGPVAQPGA